MKNFMKFIQNMLFCIVLSIFTIVATAITSIIGGYSYSAMFIISLASALLSGYLWYLYSSLNERHSSTVNALYCALGFLVALIVPIHASRFERDAAAFERSIALEVTTAAKHFDAIDTDGDGNISKSELSNIGFALTPTEQTVFRHMLDKFDEVGHQIKREVVQVHECWGGDGLSTFPGCGWRNKVFVTYGISKDDMLNYAARTLEKWKRW